MKKYIILLLILFISACSININLNETKKEEQEKKEEIKEEQITGNIDIKTISIECKENPYPMTKIKARITNNTNKTYEKQEIRIFVHLNNGTIVELPGYFGNNLKSGETRNINSSTDINLCDYKKIEYIK